MEPNNINLVDFRRTLMEWWRSNARDYPWRYDRSPYSVAIAEIMLRRTRADQVVPVYKAFLRAYPDLESAAKADPNNIREIMRTLGLYWRADSMIAFVQETYTRFGNKLPEDIDSLRSLPGVGDYVAAAIICFSHGQAVPLIDANVVRVLGRIFGLDTHGEARRRRAMRELAAKAMDTSSPADYHYALLDFAAQVCLAANPLHDVCPFVINSRCDYYAATLSAAAS